MIPAPAWLAVKGFAAQWWKLALGAAIVAGPVFLLGQCSGAANQKAADKAAWTEAYNATLKRNARANDTASIERSNDTATVGQHAKDLADAVSPLPDARPSDRRRALGCARLRSQGTDISRLPECRGLAGQAQAPAGAGSPRK